MTRTEAQTRSELIDSQLAKSGWNVKDPSQVIEEFDILTPLPMGVAEPRTPYEGHQFSDYVLLGKDRKPLAVVEAKKTSKDAALVREQAGGSNMNPQARAIDHQVDWLIACGFRNPQFLAEQPRPPTQRRVVWDLDTQPEKRGDRVQEAFGLAVGELVHHPDNQARFNRHL